MGDARISGEMDMRNMIKIVTILALLSSRGTIAQTVGAGEIIRRIFLHCRQARFRWRSTCDQSTKLQ